MAALSWTVITPAGGLPGVATSVVGGVVAGVVAGVIAGAGAGAGVVAGVVTGGTTAPGPVSATKAGVLEPPPPPQPPTKMPIAADKKIELVFIASPFTPLQEWRILLVSIIAGRRAANQLFGRMSGLGGVPDGSAPIFSTVIEYAVLGIALVRLRQHSIDQLLIYL